MRSTFRWMACAAVAPFVTLMPAYGQSAEAIARTCVLCHGPDAKGVGHVLALAGQAKENLVRQLEDFKADRRQGTIMNRIAKSYTEEQIRQIADHLASRK
jgi:cytochrome subunit of sulfide dehydrogenase